MSDRMVVLLAVLTGVGAYVARPVSTPVLIAMLCVAVLWWRPVVLCVGCAVVASALSAHAWKALDAPLPAQVHGVAILVRDPEPVARGGVRAEMNVAGRHYQGWAYGAKATRLSRFSAGDHIRVVASVRPLSPKVAPALRRRHIAGGLNVTSIELANHGNVLSRTANALRRAIDSGAGSLPGDDRSLLTGLAYGDDREESDAIKDDFQHSGLAHLLAVSGENVAFVLLLLAPVLRCFGLAGRFIGAMVALLLFGAVTRWEPSVVRAEAMVAVMLWSHLVGRPASKWRSLALGSAGAMLLDPFLVGSVGFQLSVAACAGMFVFGEMFMRMLPGPRWFRRVAAYSAAAQLGVMPIELVVFGTVPVTGVIANVLADPVAGFVMMWGIVGGLAAGVMGEPFAALIHLPNRLSVEWIRFVAHHASSAGKALDGVSGPAAWACTVLAVFWLRVRSRGSTSGAAASTVTARE